MKDRKIRVITVVLIIVLLFLILFFTIGTRKIKVPEDTTQITIQHLTPLLVDGSPDIESEAFGISSGDEQYEDVVELLENQRLYWSFRNLWFNNDTISGEGSTEYVYVYVYKEDIFEDDASIYLGTNGEVLYRGTLYTLGFDAEDKAGALLAEMKEYLE